MHRNDPNSSLPPPPPLSPPWFTLFYHARDKPSEQPTAQTNQPQNKNKKTFGATCCSEKTTLGTTIAPPAWLGIVSRQGAASKSAQKRSKRPRSNGNSPPPSSSSSRGVANNGALAAAAGGGAGAAGGGLIVERPSARWEATKRGLI